MQETIKAGTVLIKDGTLLPDAFTLESEPCSPGWRAIRGLDGYAVDRKVHNAGWTFFYLAGENQSSVFGGAGQETVRRAIKQILAGSVTENVNCLEITRIVFKTFLGVPYARVSFHLRNLQKSMFLSEKGAAFASV